MSSGRLRLSIRGNEDVFISGEPKMSYFFKRYAQTEPYGMFIVDNALETITKGRSPTYGDSIQFKVPRRADLLSKLFLKIVLPPTYLYSSLIRDKTDTFALYSLLEHVELVIGGQLIERLTGEFMFNYMKLCLGPNELIAFEQTTEMKINDLKKDYASFGQFVLLPLPFYFFDNAGYEIPLVALTRQNVTVNIKLVNKPPIAGLPELSDVTVTAEYILLGSETTRNTFIKNGMMYRVTQLQLNSTTASTSESVKVMDLNFQNPVRELFICIQPTRYQTLQNGNFFHYFCNYRNTYVNYKDVTTGYYLSEHHITGASLTLNGNYIIREDSSGSAAMMCYTIPQKYYADADTIQLFRGYVYPFVLDPLSKQPQGHINMSRILKKQLTLYLNTSQFDRNIRVYARSYNIMMIKDGLCGLMFTNPGHYNPVLVTGADANTVEGNVPTGLPVLTQNQGYYYAVKVSDGNQIVGIQLYEDDSPLFVTSRDLQDTNFSYILDTNDTFVSNSSVVLTNTNIYTPGTISQLLYTVVNDPSVTSNITIDKYSMSSTNNYIFTSNYGFVKYIRIALKTAQASPLSSLSLDINPEQNTYTNLLTTATISLYKSTTFFDVTNISAWISNAEVDTRTIRVDYIRESTGYYYSALVSRNSGGNITSYPKVNFARTYDFTLTFSVIAPTSDVYDSGLNTSTVTLQVVGLSGSGTIQVYNGSQKRAISVAYTSADSSKSYTFTETFLRTLYTYSVYIARDYTSDITRTFQLTAGIRALSLYYAIQYLPPVGSTTSTSFVAVQGYTATPSSNVLTLAPNTIRTTNAIPFTTSNVKHTVGLNTAMLSNVVYTTQVQFQDGTAIAYDTGNAFTLLNNTYMGSGNYIYSLSSMDLAYVIISLDSTNVPSNDSRLVIYNSTSAFTPATPSTWTAAASSKTYTLGQLQSNLRFAYRRNLTYTNVTRTRKVADTIKYMTTYYVPYDIVPPIFQATYGILGLGVTSQDTVNMPLNTPLSSFIKYDAVNTYLYITTDTVGATITESNTIVNTVRGNYSITFTATDTNLNSSTLFLYVAVV